jgi:sugar phosphate isomerase/epimerase
VPVLRHARAQGVKVSLENTPQTTPEDCNAVFAQLDRMPELAGGRVGMCLDMGHANLCPASPSDYLGFVDRLGTHVPIIHWHAHENWGDRDSHLPLFTGPSQGDDAGIRGLVWRLLQRGFRGNVVLEQWPDPPALLTQARDRLRRLIAQMSGTV